MEFCYLLVPFAVPDLSHRLVEAMSNDILLLTTKKKKIPVCSLGFLWSCMFNNSHIMPKSLFLYQLQYHSNN